MSLKLEAGESAKYRTAFVIDSLEPRLFLSAGVPVSSTEIRIIWLGPGSGVVEKVTGDGITASLAFTSKTLSGVLSSLVPGLVISPSAPSDPGPLVPTSPRPQLEPEPEPQAPVE